MLRFAMSFLKFSSIFLVTCLLYSCRGNESRFNQILVSHKALEAVALSLCENTDIRVKNIFAPSTIVEEWTYEFKHLSDQKIKLFDESDAILTTRSYYSEDLLFAIGRKHNINLIEVDPLSPPSISKKGMSVLRNDHKTALRFWLSITNLIQIIGNLSDDLQKIYPQQSSTIDNNATKITKNLLSLKIKTEEYLAEKSIFEIKTINPNCGYLLRDLNLFESVTTIENASTFTTKDNILTLDVDKGRAEKLSKHRILYLKTFEQLSMVTPNSIITLLKDNLAIIEEYVRISKYEEQ